MHTLFQLHPTPDKVMAAVLHFMYGRLTQQQGEQTRYQCTTSELARFIFVLGQTALNSLVYIEHIAGFAKKAAVLAATTGNVNTSSFANTSVNSSITLATPLSTPMNSTSVSSFAGGEKAVNAMEDEMDTAAAVDAEQERVRNISWTKLHILFIPFNYRFCTMLWRMSCASRTS